VVGDLPVFDALAVLEYQLLVGGAEGNIVKYSDVRVTQT